MTFSEVCAPLKLSESIRFFFQPRHIEYALGVKNVAEVSRAPERVERGSGKMLSVRTIFFPNSLRSQTCILYNFYGRILEFDKENE